MLAGAFGGCTVATRVSLSEPSPGRGTVAVSVSLDRAALAAVGGLPALRSQISLADLTAAGWSVAGPTAALDGGAVLSAEHPFTSDAQAAQLLSEVAGPGVFRISLNSHRAFLRTYHRLSGTVDLTCGIGCFGDTGLKAAAGSPVGVDPGPLERASGQQPSSVFRFSFEARLPGSVQASNTTSRRAATLVWTPSLGGATVVSASSSSLNPGPVIGLIAVAAVLIVGVAMLSWVLLRRRRRRRSGAPPGEARTEPDPPNSPAPDAETVTPPS